MGPGQLLTKLSLGENRFRAGKWREAAMHLGALADHPDAAIYPDEVADALAHAAQAEIKLRRPERAIELYEAALGLRGGHRPSLRALADLALERGEREKAASYLRRMAEESTDRARARADAGAARRSLRRARRRGAGAQGLRRGAQGLGGALGGAGRAAREDAQAAARERRRRGGGRRPRRCSSIWSRIPRSAPSAGATPPCCWPSGARSRRRPRCSIRRSARTRTTRRRCRRCATSADQLPPRLRPGRAAGARAGGAPRARRPAGGARAPGAPVAAARRAACARAIRSGAIAAFEQVVALDPRPAAGARGAGRPLRRRPGARRGGDREPPAAARRRHHALGVAARAGRHLRAPRPRRSRALLPRGAGAAGDGHAGRAWLSCEANPPPELKPDDPYAAPLDDNDREQHLAHGEATLMSEIFSCLWAGAPGPHRPAAGGLRRLGAATRSRRWPISTSGKIYGQVAKALGNKKTALYVRADGAPDEVEIVVQAPPALVVGPALAGEAAHAGRGPLPDRARHRADPPGVHPGRRACAPSSSRRCSPACSRRSTRATPSAAPPPATPPPSRPPS